MFAAKHYCPRGQPEQTDMAGQHCLPRLRVSISVRLALARAFGAGGTMLKRQAFWAPVKQQSVLELLAMQGHINRLPDC